MKPSRDLVAGIIEATCTCCAEPRALLHHIPLGPTRMVCPDTGRTFLDRGDGLYQADGQTLAAPVAEAAPPEATPASNLLSDRPARTADKTRISLERATFA
jgi:hypothetical protein